MALIKTQRRGKVAELILARPEKLNAFNDEMLELFRRKLRTLGDDPAVSCVVVRGEGRSFSVGYDVAGEREHKTAYDDWVSLRDKIEYWRDVWALPKPVIASIQGHCMGGATMLAVCADITVVADDAIIGWPTIPLGGGLLSPVSLWLIGPKRAKELSYIAGSRMTGVEAAALGWANRSVPPADLAAETRAMAEAVARTPLDLLTLKKRALNRTMDLQGFSEALMYGAEWDAIAHASPQLQPIVDKLQEVGLKETIEWFHAGAR